MLNVSRRQAEEWGYGKVSELFFGLVFALGDIGAAVLGRLADISSFDLVYRICSSPILCGPLNFVYFYMIESTTPPSTRRAAPVVADA